MLRLRVDPEHPDPAVVARCAALIRDGGVVAVPTDTLYGLAADPFNARAVRQLFAIKGRAAGHAVPLVAASEKQVSQSLGRLSPLGRRLSERFWPGPLTILLAAPPTLVPELVGGLATVGVRVPNHAALLALLFACGIPLTATSANISHQPPTTDPDVVAEQLPDIDGLFDAGLTTGGAPSTIVDVTGDRPTLVRAGAVPWEDIEACLRA